VTPRRKLKGKTQQTILNAQCTSRKQRDSRDAVRPSDLGIER